MRDPRTLLPFVVIILGTACGKTAIEPNRGAPLKWTEGGNERTCAARPLREEGVEESDAESDRARALEEALYRLCEARANNLIDGKQYQELYLKTLRSIFGEPEWWKAPRRIQSTETLHLTQHPDRDD